MIKLGEVYEKAIVADSRTVRPSVIFDLVDPDIEYAGVESTGLSEASKIEQLHDRVFSLSKIRSLEKNAWILDGSFSVFADNAEIGEVGTDLSDAEGNFTSENATSYKLANVSELRALTIVFPANEIYGVAKDFKIEVMQGGASYFEKGFSGNRENEIVVGDFLVYNPDEIRLTVYSWTIPKRRRRVAEVIPGIYEKWDRNIINSLEIKEQGDPSCVTLPYGTCEITVENKEKRFNARNKNGIFTLIEERMAIPVFLAVSGDGSEEVVAPAGTYYQSSGGWRQGEYLPTITWRLVDIIGLLSERRFFPPEKMPTTLEGWIAHIVSHLGANFSSAYTVDSAYKDRPLKLASWADINDITCGKVLIDACLACGVWPRSDKETGFLAVEPAWNEGASVTLENMSSVPAYFANEDVSEISFEMGSTKKTFSGNSSSSSVSIAIRNIFIDDEETALAAARQILSTRGGSRIEVTGRGNPASEIGDVGTVQIDDSSAVSGRLVFSTISMTGGVLADCKSTFLQADGVFLWTTRDVITESGTYVARSGFSEIFIVVIGGGTGGQAGEDGSFDSKGAKGAPGTGGNVFASKIQINDAQSFEVVIGEGGKGGAEDLDMGQRGSDTVFGAYSSANGRVYTPSYTDIQSGNVYGRTGVKRPTNGSGDGGEGGKGGSRGVSTETKSRKPGKGAAGADGASGCVIVCYS